MASTEPPGAVRPADAPTPRPAATVALLRDGAEGVEVLLLRRHDRAGFAASAWVFPGGVIDPGDAAVDDDCWQGIDPAALATRFDRTPAEVLAAHVAAVRETFEEAGILLAHHRDGRPVDPTAPPFPEVRARLNDRGLAVDWPAVLREEGVVLDLSAVVYLSRWITPIQEPRRYDTTFFVAAVAPDLAAAADEVETTEARWMTPRRALDDEDVMVIFPTEKTLQRLAAFDRAADAVADAAAQPAVEVVQPHILIDDDGRYTAIVLPDDARYPHELYR